MDHNPKFGPKYQKWNKIQKFWHSKIFAETREILLRMPIFVYFLCLIFLFTFLFMAKNINFFLSFQVATPSSENGHSEENGKKKHHKKKKSRHLERIVSVTKKFNSRSFKDFVI